VLPSRFDCPLDAIEAVPAAAASVKMTIKSIVAAGSAMPRSQARRFRQARINRLPRSLRVFMLTLSRRSRLELPRLPERMDARISPDGPPQARPGRMS
jgi:hypothetical protein